MRAEGEFTPVGGAFDELVLNDFKPSSEEPKIIAPPVITVFVSTVEQLSPELGELCPKILYIPVTEFDHRSDILKSFIENEDITVAVVLPRVIHDNEKKKISGILGRAESLGVKETLVGNIGHIQFAKNNGMFVRGDFGLNVYNSESLNVLSKLGLKSATLSFELSFSEIREMSKTIDTELITYGRLPLMITECCVIRNCSEACTCDSFTGIEDESAALFPVTPEYGCRNVVLSSKKLFMADKRRAMSSLGIWAQRLNFTTENAIECVTVLKRYMGQSRYAPTGFTRGMYFRSEEE